MYLIIDKPVLFYFTSYKHAAPFLERWLVVANYAAGPLPALHLLGTVIPGPSCRQHRPHTPLCDSLVQCVNQLAHFRQQAAFSRIFDPRQKVTFWWSSQK